MKDEQDEPELDEEVEDDQPLCGKCGYSLTGLPRRGNCPECGHPFDQMTGRGLKRAMTPEERGDRVLRLARIIGLVVFAMLAMVCGGLLSMIAVTPRKPLILAGVVASLCLVGAVADYVMGRMNRD
ncbi:MAG: hypothetical protein IT440_10445 [Phycisphaeraceae bacterium]|nr:hypothetical protein [Phycisphaeraceae bacterium]